VLAVRGGVDGGAGGAIVGRLELHRLGPRAQSGRRPRLRGETRETLRNGGWLSVHGCNDARVPWLRQHYPDEYRRLREEFPQVGRLG
jgi:hypothetical protein